MIVVFINSFFNILDCIEVDGFDLGMGGGGRSGVCWQIPPNCNMPSGYLKIGPDLVFNE